MPVSPAQHADRRRTRAPVPPVAHLPAVGATRRREALSLLLRLHEVPRRRETAEYKSLCPTKEERKGGLEFFYILGGRVL